jgi:hypothetical protein
VRVEGVEVDAQRLALPTMAELLLGHAALANGDMFLLQSFGVRALISSSAREMKR